MRNTWGWTFVLAATFGLAANAQQPPAAQPARPPVAGQPQRPATQQGTADQQIAHLIHACARNEVEISRLAQEKAKSQEVREFADLMIKEHQAQQKTMARFAGNLITVAEGDRRIETRRVDPDSREGQREADAPRDDARRGGGAAAQPGAANPRTAGGTAGGTAQQSANWVSIHQQIADEKLQSCKEELNKYKGDDFDKAYMGQQIAGHMSLVAELKVLRKHATSELQAEIDDGIESAEHHLKDARDIMDRQKDQGSENDSGRGEGRRESGRNGGGAAREPRNNRE